MKELSLDYVAGKMKPARGEDIEERKKLSSLSTLGWLTLVAVAYFS